MKERIEEQFACWMERSGKSQRVGCATKGEFWVSFFSLSLFFFTILPLSFGLVAVQPTRPPPSFHDSRFSFFVPPIIIPGLGSTFEKHRRLLPHNVEFSSQPTIPLLSFPPNSSSLSVSQSMCYVRVNKITWPRRPWVAKLFLPGLPCRQEIKMRRRRRIERRLEIGPNSRTGRTFFCVNSHGIVRCKISGIELTNSWTDINVRSFHTVRSRTRKITPSKVQTCTVQCSPFHFAKLLACVWFLSRTINFSHFFSDNNWTSQELDREEAKKKIRYKNRHLKMTQRL